MGFDLDRIFINYPPFVPAKLIDWFYKDHTQKELSYSIPRSTFSKSARRLTHFSPLRPLIKQNIDFIKAFNSPSHQLYLISSRYKFLEKVTHKLLKTSGLDKVFNSIYLNTQDEQPHLFKENIIKQNKIELYIDDDLALLQRLHKECPNTTLLWYNPFNKNRYHNGIFMITDLSEIKQFLK